MTEAPEVRQRQGENLLVGEVRIFHGLRNPRRPFKLPGTTRQVFHRRDSHSRATGH